MQRDHFTFLRSYYEAIKHLSARDQNAVLMAICAYALDGEEAKLSGASAAAFLLIKPVLDKSSERAKVGKQGGSKRKANQKQTARDNEYENEHEYESDSSLSGVSSFAAFWEAYPRKVGKDDARKAFDKAMEKTDLATLLAAVKAQCGSRQWTEDDGKYIPHPSTWLNQGRWQDELTPMRLQKSADTEQPSDFARAAVARMMGGGGGV